MPASSAVRKVLGLLLVVFAAAFPVLLYDRLVARELLRRKPPLPPLEEVVALYHQAFYNATQTTVPMAWLGVETIQNPNDVWVTQELISRLKPDFIVETGTWKGGSACLWAMVQDQVNPRGRVITVDVQDYVDEAAMPPIFRKVDTVLGDSVDPAVVADVARRVGKGSVMVVLDSDHHARHVLAEMRAYGPLVTVGSYMIVQDTDVNGHPVRPEFGPGPMEAIAELLKGDDRFAVDRSQERLMFTMHPGGYLKRMK